MSGRKGLGVKADDLIDRVIEKALVEVDRRQSELPAAERRKIAEQIGIAAVRYFLIKYSRTKVIAFDIDEALSFEGESGPYLQYAVVRANNIFQKLQERLGLDEARDAARRCRRRRPTPSTRTHELWALVLEASRLDDVVEQVVRSLEFAVLAKYGFGLAQMFNAFYHRAQILNEERDDVRRWRAAAVAYFRQQLTRVLDLWALPFRRECRTLTHAPDCDRPEPADGRLPGVRPPRRRRADRSRAPAPRRPSRSSRASTA